MAENWIERAVFKKWWLGRRSLVVQLSSNNWFKAARFAHSGRAKARPLTKRYVPNMQKLLKAYLRNEISKSDLSSAVLDIDGIETRLGRTRYLRLKHGDKRSALDLFQELNECPVCSKLHSENLASSEELFNKLDSLSTRGKIERTQKPAWYEPHLARRNPFGAQAFFKCSECASIIEVCEPERMYRGFCEILG